MTPPPRKKAKQEGSDEEYEDPLEAIKEEFVKDLSKATQDQLKEMEENVLECIEDLAEQKRSADLRWTLEACKGPLLFLGRAKASRMVRTILDHCLKTEETGPKKIALCTDVIDWATKENRTFLRRSLMARLIKLHNETGTFSTALDLAGKLVNELKKLEDRDLLVEVVLEESKAAFALNNAGKARTSLVMAKTISNSAYLTPQLQACIDMQSGILAAEENDFRTAYSYFYEAYENYDPLPGFGDEAIRALKYMCLAKCMLDEADQVKLMLTGKKRADSEHLLAMRALAKAFEKRSLAMYHETNAKYEKELTMDIVIGRHASRLYDALLEKEIIRVVEPYDVVDLDRIVALVNLPKERVERSVSALVLDKRIKGVVDQSTGTLTVYRPASSDRNYRKALNLIKALEKIVDAQYTHPGYTRVI